MEPIEILKHRLTQPRNLPILLLGAGFSLGAKNGGNEPLVLGKALAKELYDNIIVPNISNITDYDNDRENVELFVKNGDLKNMCQIIRDFNLVRERDAYLTNRMKNCHWDNSVDFGALATYPWQYVFTLNIDDLVENIYIKENKDFIVWTDKSKKYDETPDKTIIVKLHGDVSNPVGYIFDNDEYNDFISKEPRILTKFADEYVSRDLIIIGTQFQEDDLKIVLNKLFNERCVSTNYQYFFLSPNPFSRAVDNKIQENDNFHYIQMDNAEFLNNLRNWRIKYDTKKRLLLSNSFSDWNEEIEEARREDKNYELYYGKYPEASYFFYGVDIPRRAERDSNKFTRYYNVEKRFRKKLKESKNLLVTIHGEMYVGKTCLAMKLLTICAECGYQCYYTQNTENRSIEKVKEYLLQQQEGGFYAIVLENSAGCYYVIPEVLEQINKNITLVIISTSLEAAYQTKKHNLQFMNSDWEDYYISEKISNDVANDILKKLQEENHLGKLQINCKSNGDIKRLIKSKKDFINVLWYAHEGRDFITYFTDWYKQHEDEGQIEMFNLLTFYASLGCLSFPITFLPEIARALNISNFDYQEFQDSYKAFWVEKGTLISLRFVRLFADVINKQIKKDNKKEWIGTLMVILAKRTQERDHSQFNLLFETIAKVKNIEKYANLDKKTILCLFNEVEQKCKHLSYYWIQRCIIYSQCEMFEEASNAISNAEGTRKYRTYQIMHADAKNDMARGICLLKEDADEGEKYFTRGRNNIYSLIDGKNKHSSAFVFSVHTYIDMSLRYYKEIKEFPNAFEWECMKNSMWRLIDKVNFSDKIISDLVGNFVKYARENGHEKDVAGMKKRISQKGRRLVSATSYEIDELPC